MKKENENSFTYTWRHSGRNGKTALILLVLGTIVALFVTTYCNIKQAGDIFDGGISPLATVISYFLAWKVYNYEQSTKNEIDKSKKCEFIPAVVMLTFGITLLFALMTGLFILVERSDRIVNMRQIVLSLFLIITISVIIAVGVT